MFITFAYALHKHIYSFPHTIFTSTDKTLQPLHPLSTLDISLQYRIKTIFRLLMLQELINQSVEGPLVVRREITLLHYFISAEVLPPPLTIRKYQRPVMSSTTHSGSVEPAGAPVAIHTSNK